MISKLLCYTIFIHLSMFFFFLFFSFVFTCKQERSKQCYWYTSLHDTILMYRKNLWSSVDVLPRHLLKHNPIRRHSIQQKAWSPLDCHVFWDVQGHAIITYYSVPILCYCQQQKAWDTPFHHCAAFVLVRRWANALTEEEITRERRLVAGQVKHPRSCCYS